MINLLAIETSNAICSVGLRIDGNRFIRSEHVDKRHNERLLPMLSSLCEEAGLGQRQLLEKLDGVAFGHLVVVHLELVEPVHRAGRKVSIELTNSAAERVRRG